MEDAASSCRSATRSDGSDGSDESEEMAGSVVPGNDIVSRIGRYPWPRSLTCRADLRYAPDDSFQGTARALCLAHVSTVAPAAA